MPRVPVLALTATATPRVAADIAEALGASRASMEVVRATLARPNLRYSVRAKRTLDADLAALLDAGLLQRNVPVVIYTQSRALTERVAGVLSARGVRAAAYHAGMTPVQREEVEQRFLSSESASPLQLDVIVATVAFGMGIDKANVRAVINYGPPMSIADYYQQSGRAGRDGKPAQCILFHGGAVREK